MPLLNDALLTVRSHSALPRWPAADSVKSRLGPAGLRKQSSIAALIDVARDPVGSLGEVAQGWYDGLTKEERDAKAAREARKRVLYLQQRDVCRSLEPLRFDNALPRHSDI